MATIRKRPNGTYEIKVSCGYGVDGKQHNQYKSYKPEPGMTPRQIEKEVQRQAILFEEDCKRGQITAAVKFETFAEQWFEEYAKVNLRPTSYSRMKQLTKRIYPALGHKRLDKITSRDVQKFTSGAAYRCCARPSSHRAPATARCWLAWTAENRANAAGRDRCREVAVPCPDRPGLRVWARTGGHTPPSPSW